MGALEGSAHGRRYEGMMWIVCFVHGVREGGDTDLSEARHGELEKQRQMGEPFQDPATHCASGNTDPGVVLQGKLMKWSRRDGESGSSMQP